MITVAESIQAALDACASVAYMHLIDRRPIRGGIDIGVSLEMHKVGIYGRASKEAYELESEIANYPRVVIGEKAKEFLEVTLKECETGSDNYTRTAKAFLERSIGLIVQDHDGAWILDYLKVANIQQDIHQQSIDRILDFVAREQDRFKAEGNHKLALRYALLMDYILRSVQSQAGAARWFNRSKR